MLIKRMFHIVLYWQEQRTNLRGRCQCQYISYFKNSKLCNNLTNKEFIAAQIFTFLLSSASWCAVWVKQHECSVSTPTVWMCRPPYFSVFFFCSHFVYVFVNWCFLDDSMMCEYDDLFHVAGCEEGQLLWRNHMGSQELKSHCNMSGLLFYVKHALCISTTIKGIETFSTMCNWDASRVNNVFWVFGILSSQCIIYVPLM